MFAARWRAAHPVPGATLPYRPAAASTIADNLAGPVRSRALAAGHAPPICCWSPALKTADIRQTLAYGAHGPSRLLVVLVEDC